MENQNPFTGLENKQSSQNILLVHPCQHLLLFQFSKYKLVRIYLHCPLVILLLVVSDDDLIVLHKSKHTCSSHYISSFVYYHTLLLSFHTFISLLDPYFKSVLEALFIPSWKDAMKEEMLL